MNFCISKFSLCMVAVVAMSLTLKPCLATIPSAEACRYILSEYTNGRVQEAFQIFRKIAVSRPFKKFKVSKNIYDRTLTEIADIYGVSASEVSHHLKVNKWDETVATKVGILLSNQIHVDIIDADIVERLFEWNKTHQQVHKFFLSFLNPTISEEFILAYLRRVDKSAFSPDLSLNFFEVLIDLHLHGKIPFIEVKDWLVRLIGLKDKIQDVSAQKNYLRLLLGYVERWGWNLLLQNSLVSSGFRDHTLGISAIFSDLTKREPELRTFSKIGLLLQNSSLSNSNAYIQSLYEVYSLLK